MRMWQGTRRRCTNIRATAGHCGRISGRRLRPWIAHEVKPNWCSSFDHVSHGMAMTTLISRARVIQHLSIVSVVATLRFRHPGSDHFEQLVCGTDALLATVQVQVWEFGRITQRHRELSCDGCWSCLLLANLRREYLRSRKLEGRRVLALSCGCRASSCCFSNGHLSVGRTVGGWGDGCVVIAPPTRGAEIG